MIDEKGKADFQLIQNIHPLICVAGRGIPYVEKLIDRSKGDAIIDYRDGNEAVINCLQNNLGKYEKLNYAFDAVTGKGSYQNLMQVMHHSQGKLAVVLARKKYEGVRSPKYIVYLSS